MKKVIIILLFGVGLLLLLKFCNKSKPIPSVHKKNDTSYALIEKPVDTAGSENILTWVPEKMSMVGGRLKLGGGLWIIRVAPGEYTQLMIRSDGQGGTQTNTTALMGSNGIGTQGIFNPVATSDTMVFCISNLHGGAFINNHNKVWMLGETINNSDNNPYVTGSGIYPAVVDSAGVSHTAGFLTLATVWQSADAPSLAYYGVSAVDSSLWACGDLQHGMRGVHGDAGAVGMKWVQVPVPGNRRVKSIMGSINLIVLCWDGSLWTLGNSGTFQADLGWGSPSFAQSASSYSSNYDQLNQVTYLGSPLTHVRMIAGGQDCNWAIDSSNNFYAWGQYGWRVGHSNSVSADQLSNATLMNSFLSPYFNLSLIDTIVTDMACQHVLLTNGTIYGWGSTEQGTVGNGQQINYLTTSPPYFNGGANESAGASVVFNPVQIAPGISNFITLYNGIYYNYYDEAMRADGTLIGWGRNKGCALQTKTVAIDTAATVVEADYPNSWQRALPTRLFNSDTVTQIWRSTSPGCFNACTPGPTTGSPCSLNPPTCYTDHAHLTATSFGSTIYLNATTSTTTGFLPYVVFSQTAGTATNLGIPDNPVTQTDTIVNVAPGTYTYKVVIQDPNWGADSTRVTVVVTANVNYFVDSTAGSDANPGTILLPFRTLAHADAQTLIGGDTVYLKYPGTYFETVYPSASGAFGNPIVYAAYGGGKPTVSGLSTISGWTNEGGNIYGGLCLGCKVTTNMVLYDGQVMHLARWPNTGYRTFTAITSSNFTDATLPNSPSYVNMTAVLKDERYLIDTIHVTSQSGGVVGLATAPSSTDLNGNGYFFERSYALLDTTAEFYINSTTDTLYIFSATNPSSHLVQATTSDTGWYFNNKSNITIIGIDIQGYNQYAVFCNGDSAITLQNCLIQDCGNDGVIGNNIPRLSILTDTFSNINDNGGTITGTSSIHPVITNSKFFRIGLNPGMGKAGPQSYVGWSDAYGYNLYSGSEWDSIGYSGLYASGDSLNITDNHFHHFCMVKSDGGGIYTWDASFQTYVYPRLITFNICDRGFKDSAGVNFSASTVSSGIYLDGHSMSGTISNNTCAYNGGVGILVHGSSMHINNNNLYGNLYAQSYIAEAAGIPLTNLFYKYNIHGTQTSNAFTLSLYTPNNDLASIGAIDSNYYVLPVGYASSFRTQSSVDPGTIRTLSGFQTNLSYDLHSSLVNSPTLFPINPLSVSAKLNLPGIYADVFGNIIYGGYGSTPAYSSLLLLIKAQGYLTVPYGNQIIVLP